LNEPTGALKNNPKFVYHAEPEPLERFTTETVRRYYYLDYITPSILISFNLDFNPQKINLMLKK
jgi:hypothetical protein